MVRKQVGIEHSASLAVSKQQDQGEQNYKPEDQLPQDQKHHIDIDLTPDPARNINFAQQAQATYSARTLANSHEHGHQLGLQHAHLATTPLPYDLHEVASSGSILPTEIPIEDEERLERIFNKLDRDGDGRIDIHDLSAALHEFGLSSVYAEVSGDYKMSGYNLRN